MCRLEDVIETGPLERMKKAMDKGHVNEFNNLLRRAFSPEKINNEVLSFTGWDFNVTRTIYPTATTSEVLQGWDLLIENKIPLDLYTKAFLITSLYTWFSQPYTHAVEVDKVTKVSNLLSPESLELLNLCYWIHKCKVKMEADAFENKFNEVKKSLKFQNEDEIRRS
jgi:hypothetical protein